MCCQTLNCFFSESKINKDNLPEQKDFDAISVFVGSEIDKNVIDALPNLKLIAARSTGFDHIDAAYAKEKEFQRLIFRATAIIRWRNSPSL